MLQVEVVAYEDPDVRNVLVYVSEMQRSFTDRISKDFFNDPSQASIACIITGPPVVDDVGRIRGRAGKELFSQGRQLNFFQQKALRVRRVYDEPHDTAVYVAYSTRLTSASDEGGASTGRYKCGAPSDPLDAPSECTVATALLRHRWSRRLLGAAGMSNFARTSSKGE